MSDALSTEVTQAGLEIEKSQNLMKKFGMFYEDAKKIAEDSKDIVVTSEDQTDIMQSAREKRLELKNIRVSAEKVRKDLKEQSLREGRAIDGVANIIKALIVPIEKHLEEQEKFAERIQQERDHKTHQDRIDKLSQYADTSLYQLHPKDMSTDTFDQLLKTSETAYKAEQEAKKKSEEERVAREKKEAEEQERIRKENEKLREKQRNQEEKLQVERKKRQEVERKLKAEREAKEREEREIQAKAEAEKKASEEAERKALLAPDRQKLMEYANTLVLIDQPVVKSKEAQDVLDQIDLELEKLANIVRNKAQRL